MDDLLVGVSCRSFDFEKPVIYTILKRERGKILFKEVGIFESWEEIFERKDFSRIALNFLYLSDGFYHPPKFRLKLYISSFLNVLKEAESAGKRVLPVYTYGFYTRSGPLPSKITLAGIHARFSCINEYVSGLRNFRILDYDWNVQPADVLDSMATALVLHFLDTGRGRFTDVKGIRVFVPS